MKNKKNRLMAMLMTGFFASGVFTDISTVHASQTELMRPSDYITYDQNGNAYYMEQDSRLTGKFSLQPNYMLGDVVSDGIIDAGDASKILEASALAGVGILTAESLIAQENVMEEEQAFLFADINQDGKIDAVDASGILSYSAELGAGTQINPLGFRFYYANADGYLQTGFIQDAETGCTYYAGQDYALVTGWLELDGVNYYFDDNAVLQSGWQIIDGQEYYFSPKDNSMQTGWLTLPEGKYYLDENGRKHTGFLEYEGNLYSFDENGLMITNQQVSNGSYDENGIFTKKEYDINSTVREMLDNAELTAGKREITVYDRQYAENGEPVEFTVRLSDSDYAIIEKFASEHFSPDMTLSECLYETWWWIHCNVDYAYADNGWDEICNLSYPDAVFNHQSGQCVQYNGAMAAVLAYYGFDVYMVKGWTNPPKNTTQHYWTEVMLNGIRYYVETGNQGKNGDNWQYFFADADTVTYTKK